MPEIEQVPPVREPVRDQDKIMLVLSYLGILALIPLLTVKDSPYVQWHAKNGLVLGVVGALALTVLGAIGLWFFSCPGTLVLIVVDILAMVKALGGERWRLPLVTDWAEKL